MGDKVVASPKLMPPPRSLPKILHHSAIVSQSNVNLQKAPQVMKKVKIEGTNSNNLLPAKKFICSKPVTDLCCSVTKNTDTDSYTKNIVTYQIREKLYSKPNVNTRLA